MNENIVQADATQQIPPDFFFSQDLATDEQVGLSARTDMYALLCDAYRYPDAQTRSYFRKGEFRDHVVRIAGNLPYPFALETKEITGLTFSDDFKNKEIEVEYIRLFEAGPGTPPCPLVEGKHLSKESGRKTIFKDLILFYNHFGLSYAEGNSEDRPDHLIYELEFLHYLAFLELTAVQKGRDTTPLRRAQIDFLERHPAQWTGLIADRVTEIEAGLREGVNKAVVSFYRNLILITDHFVKCDLDHLKSFSING